MKAIRENWQFPEEYLREKREEQGREEEKKTEYIKKKLQEEMNIETTIHVEPDYYKENKN